MDILNVYDHITLHLRNTSLLKWKITIGEGKIQSTSKSLK